MGTTIENQARPLYEGMKVTREEYLDLEYDGFKYNMIDRVLYLTPSPNSEHSESHGRFILDLGTFNKTRKWGRLFPELDVLLPDGGDVVRPELSFILNENLGMVKQHIHGAPDLVLEILSPSSRTRDLGVKADRYLKNGVKEYWILDPRDKSLHVWNNRGTRWEKRKGSSLESELLKGFTVTAKDMFA